MEKQRQPSPGKQRPGFETQLCWKASVLTCKMGLIPLISQVSHSEVSGYKGLSHRQVPPSLPSRRPDYVDKHPISFSCETPGQFHGDPGGPPLDAKLTRAPFWSQETRSLAPLC